MNEFFKDYLESYGYSFSRPMYESKGWKAIEKEGKTYILMNTLGVSEDDIEVSVDATEHPNKQLLSVSGKTHNELFDKDFSIGMKWLVSNPIKEIVKSFQDGLMTLEIEFQSPIKPSVTIRSK